MNKFLLIVLLLISVHAICYTQTKYSQEVLENASQAELDIYLDKAIKLQKSGKTVTIVGGSILGATAITIAAIAINDSGDWALGAAAIGFFGGLAGVGTLAVGIPMNVTGKKRVERINSLKKSALINLNIDLHPSIQYNNITQNYHPALALRIRF